VTNGAQSPSRLPADLQVPPGSGRQKPQGIRRRRPNARPVSWSFGGRLNENAAVRFMEGGVSYRVARFDDRVYRNELVDQSNPYSMLTSRASARLATEFARIRRKGPLSQDVPEKLRTRGSDALGQRGRRSAE